MNTVTTVNLNFSITVNPRNTERNYALRFSDTCQDIFFNILSVFFKDRLQSAEEFFNRLEKFSLMPVTSNVSLMWRKFKNLLLFKAIPNCSSESGVASRRTRQRLSLLFVISSIVVPSLTSIALLISTMWGASILCWRLVGMIWIRLEGR